MDRDQQLGLVCEYVNTLDLETGVDRLGTPDELATWFSEQGLVDDLVEPSAPEHAEPWPCARRSARCCSPTTASRPIRRRRPARSRRPPAEPGSPSASSAAGPGSPRRPAARPLRSDGWSPRSPS